MEQLLERFLVNLIALCLIGIVLMPFFVKDHEPSEPDQPYLHGMQSPEE